MTKGMLFAEIRRSLQATHGERADEIVRELEKHTRFHRLVEIAPAYDHVAEGNGGGIHGAEIGFVLLGDAGAVRFMLMTNWMLPETNERIRREQQLVPRSLIEPLPADLGYHSRIPRRGAARPARKDCPYLDGAPCYYDGSGLNARPVFERLLREGDAGVWDALEKYYLDVFLTDHLDLGPTPPGRFGGDGSGTAPE